MGVCTSSAVEPEIREIFSSALLVSESALRFPDLEAMLRLLANPKILMPFVMLFFTYRLRMLEANFTLGGSLIPGLVLKRGINTLLQRDLRAASCVKKIGSPRVGADAPQPREADAMILRREEADTEGH